MIFNTESCIIERTSSFVRSILISVVNGVKTAAVIAELNPLHTGHEYLLEQLRESGAERVVLIMSGNFVQRGDYAVFDKFDRDAAAVECGADLVVELPLPWAMAGAQTFAKGGAALARALGGVDTLAFGCECGDAEALTQVAQTLRQPAFSQAVKAELSGGVSFAAARQNACEKLMGASYAALLSSPNNALAVEYIAALQGSGIEPFAVKRVGAGHDSAKPTDGEPLSGSLLREKLRRGEDVSAFVPPSLLSCPHTEVNRLDTAVLAKLRAMQQTEFSCAPDLSEGLENRIFAASRKAGSLEELFALSKTKRYPLARIRRIVWSLFLGVTAQDAQLEPLYLRVLAANETGKTLLTGCTLPVLARAAQTAQLDERGRHIFELECAADDVFGLCFTEPRAAGRYFPTKL